MKLNYKRDGILGIVCGVVSLVSSLISFNADSTIKAITMLIIGLLLICLGIFCLIKSLKAKHN